VPDQLTLSQLTAYKRRIETGNLSEAVNVYNELKSKGYHYAGWGHGVATGTTITGASALDFLSSTALLGLDTKSCRDLTTAQIDKVRVDMSLGYLNQLMLMADAGVDRIITFVSQFQHLVAEVVHIISIVAAPADHEIGTRHTIQNVVLVIADQRVVEAVAGAVDALSCQQPQLFNMGIENVVGAGDDGVITFILLFQNHIVDAVDSGRADLRHRWLAATPATGADEQPR